MATENLYTKDCIRTVSGIYVNVFEPKPEMFVIEDIAHALSFMPRFAGHLRWPYSVAQHSLAVSNGVYPQNRLAGLLHDASEAYLMDLPRPIKHKMQQYKEVESRIMVCVAERFGFDWPLHDDIKKCDEDQLEWEWQELMLNERSFYVEPELIKNSFLFAFKMLTSRPAFVHTNYESA